MPRKAKVKRDYLTSLPVELKNLICTYLGPRDIVRLLQVNRIWNRVLDNSEAWKSLYLKDVADVKRVYLSQALHRCYECRLRKATHPSFVYNQRVCEACYDKIPKIAAGNIWRLYKLSKRERLQIPGPINPPSRKNAKLYSVTHIFRTIRLKLGSSGWQDYVQDFKNQLLDTCINYQRGGQSCRFCNLQYLSALNIENRSA